MDRKADRAVELAEQLKQDQETVAGNHRHMDGCTAERSKQILINVKDNRQSCIFGRLQEVN